MEEGCCWGQRGGGGHQQNEEGRRPLIKAFVRLLLGCSAAAGGARRIIVSSGRGGGAASWWVVEGGAGPPTTYATQPPAGCCQQNPTRSSSLLNHTKHHHSSSLLRRRRSRARRWGSLHMHLRKLCVRDRARSPREKTRARSCLGEGNDIPAQSSARGKRAREVVESTVRCARVSVVKSDVDLRGVCTSGWPSHMKTPRASLATTASHSAPSG